MDAVNKYAKLDYAVAPTLFFEFHGTKAGVAEQVGQVKEFATEQGGTEFRWAATPEERIETVAGAPRRLLRRAGAAAGRRRAGRPMSACRSRGLPNASSRPRAISDQSFVTAVLVGHVGDGNFHLAFILDPDKPEELAEARRLNDRMVQRAIAMDGTCTGEHGIGYGKMDFLIAEHGDAVAVMRTLKRALDPDNIMNPGKIVRV